MRTPDLDALAESLGVTTSYWDVHGELHHASERTLRAVCELLAPDDGSPAVPIGPIDEVVVVHGGRFVSGASETFEAVDVVVVLEDGAELPARRVSFAAELVPADLPVGMHRLRSRAADGHERESALLVAPAHFSRPARDRPGRTLFAPTYALWDLDEPLPSYDLLGRLGEAVAGFGIDTIATLPLYSPGSGDDFESSPYSPASRFHWNELMIPDRLLGADPAARGDTAPAARVDWSDVEVMRFAQLTAKHARLDGRERAALAAFLARRPDVVSFASFAAAGDGHPAHVHEMAQWLAERALGDLLAELDDRGQRLALDLPVGARVGGWETATWPHLFSLAASIGAPPDTFFASGQNWALPPFVPTASRRDGHRVWHDLLETACRYARVVRIDHVMQMYRLWWIPEGHAADDGVYVRYPADELLAVAAIVAEQTGTTMIGEDLGTVPQEMSDLIADWRLIGMYEEVITLHSVAERPDDPPATLPPVPVGRWAGIRTHDMPALAATVAETPTDRYRHALEADLGHPVGRSSRELMAAMVERLDRSDATDVVVDLDDLLGTTLPHNVPGIVDDLNWTKRSSSPISALADAGAFDGVFDDRERKVGTPMYPTSNFTADRGPVGDLDLHLFFEGAHRRVHDFLGAHPSDTGCWFSVWAPNAREVRVLVESDGWLDDHWLDRQGDSGIWSGHVEGVHPGAEYHFRVISADGTALDKADPVAAASAEPPSTVSRVARLDHDWNDDEWMATRGGRIGLDAPVSIYEVHLGSWGRTFPTGGRRFPTYVELADPLADHAAAHGFTHVELLPVMEHPFYGSWGYQTTGYFAPTARHGTPQDFMAMVDRLHQRGVGVICDWVPSHFPFDAHGPANFDGTALYEHADPRQGYHPDWNSAIFNYGRNEVRAFLRSSAMCWLERFHIDGLRIDAVASMLYLDYSREDGEWIPNMFGGRENLEAISFLRDLNETIYSEHPDVATFAEESTAWPMVSRPTYIGGLGFGYKWDMGWMHDALEYTQRDPMYRSHHYGEITFRGVYAFSENFMLPLSHDEVVHGKGSILGKMPGDDWQRFANVRLLYGMQWTQPGKKLLFMGDELAAPTEWNHEGVLDWELHDAPGHGGVRRFVAALNHLYRSEPAMHRLDSHPDGFGWIVADDAANSVYAYGRYAPGERPLTVVVNATPMVHHQYRIGVPVGGRWHTLLNSDSTEFDGSGVEVGPGGVVDAVPVDSHGQFQSILLTLPPLAVVVLAPEHP